METRVRRLRTFHNASEFLKEKQLYLKIRFLDENTRSAAILAFNEASNREFARLRDKSNRLEKAFKEYRSDEMERFDKSLAELNKKIDVEKNKLQLLRGVSLFRYGNVSIQEI